MSRIKIILLLLPFCSSLLRSQDFRQRFVTSDIDHFWEAYAKITSTKDSTFQYNYLKELYLDKASPGLAALREVRHYSERDYLQAINNYPVFWNSIKANTLDTKELLSSIETDLNKLKQLYPRLTYLPVYFVIGAFRTSGTANDNKVLIGAELSLGDDNTATEELPARLKKFYKDYRPRENIALLCTHEYIHTQQKEMVHNLLSKCLYEGIAEFISCKASGKKSNSPAIDFGKTNEQKVVDQFVKDLYIMDRESDWLWGENTNDLKMRDLGYFIGYEFAERYYDLSKDKLKAVEELIELDYHNEKQVEQIVNATRLLPKPLHELYKEYENKRPTVISISPFKNGSTSVQPGLTKITVIFSEPLNSHNTGIDFGPLGETACPRLTAKRSWSADARSWTFEAELEPGKNYQVLISNNFRKQDGVRLKSYLLEFTTSD